MQDAGVPAALRNHLVQGGYTTATIFRYAFRTPDALTAFARVALLEESIVQGVTMQNFEFHPATGSLHALLASVTNAESTSAPLAPLAAAVPDAANDELGKRLTPDVLASLKSDWAKSNPTEIVDEWVWPCKALLQMILSQTFFYAFEWIPWAKLQCEEAALLAKMGGKEVVSGSPYKIEKMLLTRGVAFSMCKGSHFVAWKLYVAELIKAYTSKPPTDMRRQATMQECEEADRAALREVFRLVSNGWGFDDAIHEIVVIRDRFRTLLVPQFKPPPKADWKPREGRKRPFPGSVKEEDEETEADSKGKGKGKGEGKGKTDGLCNRFNSDSGCRSQGCKFKHECRKCGSTRHGATSSQCRGH